MTVQAVELRHDIRTVMDRLVCEYAGAVPAGQVIHQVRTIARRLLRTGLRGPAFVELLEHSVRSELVPYCRRLTAAG